MHGQIDVDLTAAWRLLVEDDAPSSLAAFVVASVGRAATAHPEVHAHRDWLGRLVEHQYVDVQTLIEVPTGQGPSGLVRVVRDADVRSVADISAELRAVKAASATTTGHLLDTVAPAIWAYPRRVRRHVRSNEPSRRVRRAVGTVSVSAVGVFGGGGGFAIAPPTLRSLTIIIGGLSRRP